MEPAPDLIDDPAKPASIVALLGQLAEDTRSFARAEIVFLKAQAGERVEHAMPGLVAIIMAMTLAIGVLIAVVVTAMVTLAAAWGAIGSILIVSTGTLLTAGLSGWWGIRRMRSAMKSREVR